MYGLELSTYCVDRASRKFRTDVASGRIDITLGSVELLPYPTNMFDSAFHCNCYLFWSNRTLSCAELFRVLKPGSTLVTTVDMLFYKLIKDKGLLTSTNVDPINYMHSLESVGFHNVRVQYLTHKDVEYPAILANINDNAHSSSDHRSGGQTAPGD